MAYSDFTLAKLRQKLGIEQEKTALFGEIDLVEPSDFLKADVEDGLNSPISTEKAKSELIIYPILKELKRRNPNTFSIFSGYIFIVDETRELTGICEFLLTKRADIAEPEAPVFCLVEAKNGVAEDGFGQCAAEMLAARIFNERDKEPTPVIYGCVTNAFEWIFMKLEADTVYIDTKRYLIDNLPGLLGILQHILKKFTQNPQAIVN